MGETLRRTTRFNIKKKFVVIVCGPVSVRLLQYFVLAGYGIGCFTVPNLVLLTPPILVYVEHSSTVLSIILLYVAQRIYSVL